MKKRRAPGACIPSYNARSRGGAAATEDDLPDTPLVRALESYRLSPNRLIPVFLRFGATLDTTLIERYNGMASHAYLAKVHTAGGWKRYERAHRMRLTTTFARVVFPRVPTEVVAHIVDLWAHVGYY